MSSVQQPRQLGLVHRNRSRRSRPGRLIGVVIQGKIRPRERVLNGIAPVISADLDEASRRSQIFDFGRLFRALARPITDPDGIFPKAGAQEIHPGRP